MKRNWKLACTVIMIAVVGLFWACGEDGPASPTSMDALPSATPQVSASTSDSPANPTASPTYTDRPDLDPKRGNNPFGSGYACEDYPVGVESVWINEKKSKWTIWTVNNTTDQRWRVSGKVFGEKEPGCGRTTKGRRGADDILVVEDPEWIEVGETRDVRWRIDMSAMYNEDYLCGRFQFGIGLTPEKHGNFWNHTDRVIDTGSDECEPPPSDECKKTEDPSRKGWECEWLGDEICKWGCKCVPTEKPECPELIWNYESCSYVGGCLTCVDVTLDADVTMDDNNVAHASATGSGATHYMFQRHNMGSSTDVSMPWSEDFQLNCGQQYLATFKAYDGDEVCETKTVTETAGECCEPVRYTSSPLNYSATGWAGWSCPADTHAIGGGVTGNTYPMGAQGIAQPGATIGGHTYPGFPHYTFGSGETGYVAQNGGTSQTVQIYVDCLCNPGSLVR